MPLPPFMSPPRRSAGRALVLIALLILLGLSLLFNVFLAVGSLGGSSSTQSILASGNAGQRIAVVPVMGQIDRHQAEMFSRLIHRAEEDSAVKALIIQIDSPGGTVTASDQMYNRLLTFKKNCKNAGRNVPVVISMSELGTSGAYYLSCAGDYLIAERTALTGNIGVLFPNYNYSKLLDKIGVQDLTVVSSGTPYKDAGDPGHPPTTRATEYFQANVDYAFDQFKDVVNTARKSKLPKGVTIDDVADGRAYPAADALKKGLIDQVGYLEDAENYAATAAGLKNPEIVKYQEPASFFSLLSGDADSKYDRPGITIKFDASALDRLQSSRMMYLYRGESPPSR